MQWKVRTDRTLIRAQARSTRYVLLDLVAPSAPVRRSRAPLNVSFVLDRSGSMRDERKFDLAREAVLRALAMLQPTDRFSVVVYDTEIDVLTRSTPATHEAVRCATGALAEVAPRGGTDLAAGWLRGCEQVAEFLVAEGVNRVLLLTDGLANQGIVDRELLAQHAAALRSRGVSSSTLGVGADFDERLLRDVAHEGGGNFYFISSPGEIVACLTSELVEALEVTVRHAAVELQLGEGIEAEVLHRYRSEADSPRGSVRVMLGDLASGQQLSMLVAVRFPPCSVGGDARLGVRLTGDGAGAQLAPSELVWRYDTHAANDAQSRDVEVSRAVAKIYAARARAEATEANRAGDMRRAERVIRLTRQRIGSYAGNDLELQSVAADLVASIPRYASAAMPAMALKQSLFAEESALKSRDVAGRARR